MRGVAFLGVLNPVEWDYLLGQLAGLQQADANGELIRPARVFPCSRR